MFSCMLPNSTSFYFTFERTKTAKLMSTSLGSRHRFLSFCNPFCCLQGIHFLSCQLTFTLPLKGQRHRSRCRQVLGPGTDFCHFVILFVVYKECIFLSIASCMSGLIGLMLISISVIKAGDPDPEAASSFDLRSLAIMVHFC